MKEKEGEGSASDLPMSPGKTSRERRQDLKVAVAIWLGYFVFALFWQIQSGAWSSDFGGHADEAAHVVTGLMVRDYIAGGFLEQWHPMRYAEDYYERFPKVAIGHYPPGFYIVEALFLLPYRQPGAVLVMMVCLAATVGWQTWRIARDLGLESWVGVLLGALVIWLPLVRTYTAIVMSDLLLVILILEATRAFGRFLEKERWRDSWAFGIFAALAILTKGSGLLLALVPPLAIALTGRWRLIKSPRLWVAPVPVVVLALPWMLATRHITEEGMSTIPFQEYVFSAIAKYFPGVAHEIGWLAAVISVVAALLMLKRDRRKDSGMAVLWALVLGLFIFYLSIPSGLDLRYLLPLFPPLLVMAAYCLRRLVGWAFPQVEAWAVVGLAAIIAMEVSRPVEKRYVGASAAVESILASNAGEERINVLVVSDTSGEGAITAAAAFLSPRLLQVDRGSKQLASSDWLGRGYETKFEDGDSLQSIFRERGTDFVVIEKTLANKKGLPLHWTALEELLEDEPNLLGARIGDSITLTRKNRSEGALMLYRIAVPRGGIIEPSLESTRTAQSPLGVGRDDPVR